MVGYSFIMRHRTRRTTALVLNVLMQLTLMGSGRACAMHTSQNAHSETAAGAHAMGHESVRAQHQVARVTTLNEMGTLGRCELPCAPAACGFAVTCGVTAAAPAASGFSPAAFASNGAVALAVVAPRSLTTAPEPPPPRA